MKLLSFKLLFLSKCDKQILWANSMIFLKAPAFPFRHDCSPLLPVVFFSLYLDFISRTFFSIQFQAQSRAGVTRQLQTGHERKGRGRKQRMAKTPGRFELDWREAETGGFHREWVLRESVRARSVRGVAIVFDLADSIKYFFINHR
jgi:hypothetical protein